MDWHTIACTIATLLRKDRPAAAVPAGFRVPADSGEWSIRKGAAPSYSPVPSQLNYRPLNRRAARR